jgi:AraC family transcriptional regulator, regulatory protein of adaptative response / methylated-DNA-[protein]-cysteine methyltransferase
MKNDIALQEELRGIDDETRWLAILTRDSRFKDVFVYGVRSTGIYCKPTCASRRPRREQVVYFPSFESAEAARFRACKRCEPNVVNAREKQVELVMRACRIIEGQAEGATSLGALSTQLDISSNHLQRTFKKITGVTPRQYAAAHRLEQFKSLVSDGNDVTGAMYDAGFGSSRGLYENASEKLGMTPSTYQKGGKGMSIKYTIVDCYLGRLLIAATESGVCAVRFGDDDQTLETTLRNDFSAAEIRADAGDLNLWVNQLLDYLKGSQPHLDLPLDVQATAFQLRVWEELRKIPYGATRSYREVALAIGQPTASRAVASACAANSVAVVIPCHRVVREDGKISGYRWGKKRKKALLESESTQRLLGR